jgi:hypothetical protein
MRDTSNSQWPPRRGSGLWRIALWCWLGLTLLVSGCGTGPTTTFRLVVDSFPNSVLITVSPGDNLAQTDGTTEFTRTYDEATPVVLTAPPNDGHNNLFTNWTGCDISSVTDRTCNVTMNGKKGVTANFGAPQILKITKMHTDPFTAGQLNATYSVTVSNVGNGPTSGIVTVTEMAPSGLTLISMDGAGWTCPANGNSNQCTRSDALNGGISYPAITVTVNVATIVPSSLMNQVSVSGGGSAPASASDPTNISDFTVSAAPAGSPDVVQGASTAVTVTAAALNGFSGTVSFDRTQVTFVPTGPTAISFTPTFITLPGATQTTLLVQTFATTPTGSLTITIPATEGSVSHSATATLNVIAAGPQSTILAPGSHPSMDILGDTIVAEEDLTTTPFFTSDAAVFVKDSAGQWTLATRLINPSDNIVASVAISGDGKTVVVGSCKLSNCTGASTGNHAGEAFVYAMPAGGWSAATGNPTATLTASDGVAGDRIGYSVSIDQLGATVAVGAPKGVSTGSPQLGSVYVFAKPLSGVWADAPETAKLTVSGPPPSFNNLGISVSLDSAGDTIAVGATNLNNNFGNSGTVFVFKEPSPSGGWTTATTANAALTASDGVPVDALGYAVSISGDGRTIVAGAPENPFDPTMTPTSGPGAAYVFVRQGTDWISRPSDAKLTALDRQRGDSLGAAVSVSDDGFKIVVGAPVDPVTHTNGSGAAYEFVRPGSGWAGSHTETSRFSPFTGQDQNTNNVTPTSTNGQFGGGVAISGNAGTIAVSGNATVAGTSGVSSVIYLF